MERLHAKRKNTPIHDQAKWTGPSRPKIFAGLVTDINLGFLMKLDVQIHPQKNNLQEPAAACLGKRLASVTQNVSFEGANAQRIRKFALPPPVTPSVPLVPVAESSPEKPDGTGVAHRRSSRPGKICFLTSCTDPWGGSEELWAGAAERLHTQNFDVMVVRSGGPKGLWGGHLRLANAGIRTKNYPQTPWTRVVAGIFRRLWHRKPAFRRLCAYTPLVCELRSFNGELAVIAQGEAYDGIDGFRNLAESCELAGVPYVLVCQRASEDSWPRDAARQQIRKAFVDARRVFFVSEHNRRCIQRQLSLPLPNAEVIRNPFMVEAEQPLPWPHPKDGVLRLACVARLCARDKGQDLLLDVLSRASWRGRKLEVNFYGQGINAQGLEAMARTLGLTNVRFYGFTHDVTQVWREHHALVLPSRHEGLPLVLVEAMMCGRLGIVTDAGGITEVVDDGVTGFVAPTTDADALDHALERAWSRRQEWESLGREAARVIRQRVPRDPCEVFAEKLAALHAECGSEATAVFLSPEQAIETGGSRPSGVERAYP